MANSLASGALAGALTAGTISKLALRYVTLRLTFHAPNLTVGPRRDFFWG
jgi:hypothetical protein